MLKFLRIANFKGWKDTGVIRMAPITLFFGANSSGKSSIGQFLMMLKQTVESSDRKTVFYPGGRNSAVQLGSYKEMVFRRDPQNKIEFEYKWSLPEAAVLEDFLSKKSFSGNHLSFAAEIGMKSENQSNLALSKINYRLGNQNDGYTLSIGMNRILGSDRTSDTGLEFEVVDDPSILVRKQARPWDLRHPVRFYGFPDEVTARYKNADFVQILNLEHEKLFESIRYLGPLRTKAERLYSWPGSEPESVGYTGENTIAAILAARGRKISMGFNQRTKPFEGVIAAKLKEMGLIEAFKVNAISEARQEYEVKVRTKGSSEWVDLPDVGFGVSQVLPVLVQCFYAPAGSIIIMEQPEIHLHPKAQSVLADVMIDVINSRQGGENRSIQLIIETHSEHFLRRLQRRIAEDSLSENQVSAYFADISRIPAVLEPLQIDPYGSILNWPKDFFGDEMGDIIEQSKAAMKKRKQSAKNEEASK